MQLSIELPEDIVRTLQEKWGDLSRHTVEALAIEGYRTRVLTRSQVARLLNLETRMEVDAFLKKAEVYLDYTGDDLKRDRKAHRDLTNLRSG